MASERNPPSAELIDRLQRRRTRLAFTQFVFFAIWQGNFLALSDNPHRLVDHVKLSAYIVWSIVLLAFIGTGGGWIQPREVRAILNDESTREHRQRAIALGYWAAMGVAIACYAVNLITPLTPLDVIHLVLSAGIGAALVSFGLLERRAQRYA